MIYVDLLPKAIYLQIRYCTTKINLKWNGGKFDWHERVLLIENTNCPKIDYNFIYFYFKQQTMF